MKNPVFWRFFIGINAFILFSCGPRIPFQKRTLPPIDKPDITDFQSQPGEAVSNTNISIMVHPKGNPQSLVSLLQENPELKLTLFFPPGYFEKDSNKSTLESFRVLYSSGQIEVGMIIQNQPPLPLIANLRDAGANVLKWGFNFKWPDDVAGQLARAATHHHRRWGQRPRGFYPPYGSLSEDVIRSAQRLRFNWVLTEPSQTYGAKFFGSMAVLIPPDLPYRNIVQLEDPLVIQEAANSALKWPFSLIIFDEKSSPAAEIQFLIAMLKYKDKSSSKMAFHNTTQFSSYLRQDNLLTSIEFIYRTSFPDWVQTPFQKQAWAALSEARETIDTYQNSGRAQMQKLDAALEEIYLAESGPFLLSLGDPEIRSTESEQNFIATLSNVYRHCGVAIPSQLNRLFKSARGYYSSSKTADEDSSGFFRSTGNQLLWMDPKGDDFGDGKYQYPMGSYSSGGFDLRQFEISFNSSYITFSASVDGDWPVESRNLLIPSIDIYLSVNKLANAGSLYTLKARGATQIDRQAAWEYALSMKEGKAILYQGLTGGEYREIESLDPVLNLKNNEISVRVSRRIIRGEPRDWRFTVGLGGVAGKNLLNQDMAPILIRPSAQAFGGAHSGRNAPRYIDVLAPTTEDQTTLYKTYQSGRSVTLPYVEYQP